MGSNKFNTHYIEVGIIMLQCMVFQFLAWVRGLVAIDTSVVRSHFIKLYRTP